MYRNTPDSSSVSGTQNNFFMNVTLQEWLERLDRLGLPRPIVKSDNEEDYAPNPEDTDNP